MLPSGSTIGILGGGQLARMLAMAGARLGLESHVFSPVHDDPAFHVCNAHTKADFLDEDALAAFAESVDVVTYEFENVPARTAEVLEAHRPVRPNPKVLALTQDRLVEKDFVRGLGIATADFADVTVEDHGESGSAWCPPGVWMRVPVRYTSSVEAWGGSAEQAHNVDFAIAAPELTEWVAIQSLRPEAGSLPPVTDAALRTALESIEPKWGPLQTVLVGPTTMSMEPWTGAMAESVLTGFFENEDFKTVATVLTWDAFGPAATTPDR